MLTESEIITVPADCEIITTRMVEFSRDKVFSAWTNPEYLKKWWGPEGFTNTFNLFDLRPGGAWSFVMHGPDKKNYPNECVFIKIEAPRLIVWNHYSDPQFQVEARFESISTGRTMIIFKMKFATPDLASKMKRFVPEKNEENMDRLEMLLKTIS